MAPLFYCKCTNCKCMATVLLTVKEPPDPPPPTQRIVANTDNWPHRAIYSLLYSTLVLLVLMLTMMIEI